MSQVMMIDRVERERERDRDSVQMNQTLITKTCYMTGENLKISHMCPK